MNDQVNALIKRARMLLDNAAPTPWEAVNGLDVRVGHGGGEAMYFRVASCQLGGDADFIAAAPELVAGLCDALETAERRAEEAEAQAAAMRGALDKLLFAVSLAASRIGRDRRVEDAAELGRMALSSDAGRALLYRLRAAEAERDAPRAKLAETTALHGIAESRENRMERELLAIWATVRTGDPAPLTEADVLHAVEDIRRERDALRAEVEKEAALRAGLTAEVKRLKTECIAVAKGCTDYRGGYSGAEYDAFQGGVATVVNALQSWIARGDSDTQTRALIRIGKEVGDK